MDILNGLLTRRSIRKYTGEPVLREKVEEIVKYGMYAPSASNRQPWHFVLTDNREIFGKIMEVHPHATMLAQAQWAIVVCGDEKTALSPEYWPVDCSAATQNILLAAHGMGYGAVWLGIYPRTERMAALKTLLELPAHIHAFSVVSVGVPAQETGIPERFHSDRIHIDRW